MANELAVRMFQIAAAKLLTKPLYVAAQLGIADTLASGSRSVEELARETGTHAPSLYRILRALASAGVFAEREGRTFEMTPLAELIRSGPRTMRGMVLWLNDPRHDHMFERLGDTVRDGQTVAMKTHGKPVWEYLAETPDLGAVFNQAMTGNAHNAHAAALEAYDFGKLGTLVDVGGGHGALLTRILAAHPSLRGVVFDQPHVVEGARKTIADAGLEARCEPVGGDFFESVPASGAHVMSFILHDWYDADALRILASIRRAQPPGGRLIVIEQVILPGNEPSFGKLIDIEMLAMAGGLERTEPEYRSLFERAGFRLERVIATQSPTSVLEATRA